VIASAADNAVLYGAYVAAWAFFAYGPQLAICMLFAWSGCKRVRGDKLNWLAVGFLWSLLPFIGLIAMWWTWRRASREGRGAASHAGGGAAPAA